MNVTIVSVGPCLVRASLQTRTEANGNEHVMLVDNGRELVVWRVHEMLDEGDAPVYYAHNGDYYPYDRQDAALLRFVTRAGLRNEDLRRVREREERRTGRIRTLEVSAE